MSRIPLVVGLLAIGASDCGNPGEGWATFDVTGTVSNSQGQPASGMDVRVETWQPNACGAGTVGQLVTTRTNNGGAFSTRLTSLTSTYSACIRVIAGSASTDTTVLDKPALQAVNVDIVIP